MLEQQHVDAKHGKLSLQTKEHLFHACAAHHYVLKICEQRQQRGLSIRASMSPMWGAKEEVTNEITLLRVIPTMTFQNSRIRFYVSRIVPGEGRHTTHLLKCVRLLSTSQTAWRQSSDILPDVSFDILWHSSDIHSDISFDIF